MKIKIITLHRVINNYGSVLQGLALCRFLNCKGYDAEVIDYRPRYSINGIAKFRSMAAKIIFLPYYIVRTRKFEKFILNNNTLTKIKYNSYKELLDSPPEADLYIAGSDQIWNSVFPCGKDSAYYLEFVQNGAKISYAASLGRDAVSIEELQSIKDKIKDFKDVIVREESGKKLLQSVGLENVKHAADPVFLLGKNEYLEMVENVLISNQDQKYLLVYAVEKDEMLSKIVSILANKMGLKVISIGGFSNKCKSDKFDRTASPGDFIRLINNAEFVVTSSFHCVAFSLIFNKQFAAILPSKNPTRLENIIEIAGLKNRIIKNANLTDEVIRTIDYGEPNRKLNIYIENSKKILCNAINYENNIERCIKTND